MKKLFSILSILLLFNTLTAQVTVNKKELPPQSGHAGQYLSTNGIKPSWLAVSNYTESAAPPAVTYLDPVISQTNTPVASPTSGDRFLVGTSPTGAFVTHANQIAEWNGSVYVYTTPVMDDVVYITSTLTTMKYNGTSWNAWIGVAVLHEGNSLSTSLAIGTNNLKDLIFKTNNSAAGIVKTTGNWGFGTMIPSARATYKGSTSDNTAKAADYYNSSNNVIAVFRNDGYVGIGTASPTAAFEIKSSGNTGSTYGLLLKNSSGSDVIRTYDNGLITGSGTNTESNFQFGNSAVILGGSNLTLGSLDYSSNSTITYLGNSEMRLNFQRYGGQKSTLYSNGYGFKFYKDGTTDLSILDPNSLRLGINSSETNIEYSSALQINSTTQGFLPPRMTATEAEAIGSKAEGLMIYSTNGTGSIITSKGWWGWSGSTWEKLNP